MIEFTAVERTKAKVARLRDKALINVRNSHKM